MTFPCRPNKDSVSEPTPQPDDFELPRFQKQPQLKELFGPHPDLDYNNLLFALWGAGFIP
jgi:hypothetical protein